MVLSSQQTNPKMASSRASLINQEKLRASISNNTFIGTASGRLYYFFRLGKLATVENKRRARFIERAIKKPMRQSTAISNSIKFMYRFKSFFISATPFIGLKTRRMRRGKRVRNKVTVLTRRRSRRKSFLEFASTVYVSGRSAKPFNSRLENALELMHINHLKRKTGVNNSTIFDKRVQLYATAYKVLSPSRNKRKVDLKVKGSFKARLK